MAYEIAQFPMSSSGIDFRLLTFDLKIVLLRRAFSCTSFRKLVQHLSIAGNAQRVYNS